MNRKSLLGRISMKHVFFIVLAIAAVWAVYSLLLVRRLAPLAEETQKQKAEFWANQIEPFIDEKLDSLVWTGDTAAYHELRQHMHDEPTAMQMGYSMIMAIRHEYPAACYDLYADIVSIYDRMGVGWDSMDINCKELALLYLRKAAARGEPRALKEVRQLGVE